MNPPKAHHRTLFLSDLHLGALGCRSDLILAFLQSNPAHSYILVGDVLDLWQPLLPHWSACDQAVIDHLRACQAAGAELLYLRGNHDPDPEAAPGAARLKAKTQDELIHEAADGRRYLVLHGDIADARAIRWHCMTRFGSLIDHALRRIDTLLSRLRRASRPEARSTIEAVLSGVNTLMYRGRSHELRLTELARNRGVDGVICGHFHIAGLHERAGLVYANCGDWVDSFTALAEAEDGGLHLLGGRGRLGQPHGAGQGVEDYALAEVS